MTGALEEFDKVYASNKAQVEEDILNRAIEGLSKGQMDYGQDFLLTSVLEKFRENAKKLTSLTEEE